MPLIKKMTLMPGRLIYISPLKVQEFYASMVVPKPTLSIM